jgi:Skp family chaperone for outer membrane proteins
MGAELKRIEDALKGRKDIPKKVREKLTEISHELKDVEKAFKKDWRGMEFGIMDLSGKVQATTAPPTQAQRTITRRFKEKLDSHIKRINDLITREFPDLQVELVSKGVSLFVVKPIRLPRRY